VNAGLRTKRTRRKRVLGGREESDGSGGFFLKRLGELRESSGSHSVFLIFFPAAIALAEKIDACGDETDDHRTTYPCHGRLFYLAAESAELFSGVEFAGGKAGAGRVRDAPHTLGQCMLGSMREKLADVLAEQGDVLTYAGQKLVGSRILEWCVHDVIGVIARLAE